MFQDSPRKLSRLNAYMATGCLRPVNQTRKFLIGSYNIRLHLWYFVKSGHREHPKHVGLAHCQQRIVVPAQSVGVPLNGVIINLGSFAIVEGPSFSSSAFYASPVILHRFSPATYFVRAFLVASTNSAPLLSVLVWVFFPCPHLFPPVSYLKTLQASLC